MHGRFDGGREGRVDQRDLRGAVRRGRGAAGRKGEGRRVHRRVGERHGRPGGSRGGGDRAVQGRRGQGQEGRGGGDCAEGRGVSHSRDVIGGNRRRQRALLRAQGRRQLAVRPQGPRRPQEDLADRRGRALRLPRRTPDGRERVGVRHVGFHVRAGAAHAAARRHQGEPHQQPQLAETEPRQFKRGAGRDDRGSEHGAAGVPGCGHGPRARRRIPLVANAREEAGHGRGARRVSGPARPGVGTVVGDPGRRLHHRGHHFRVEGRRDRSRRDVRRAEGPASDRPGPRQGRGRRRDRRGRVRHHDRAARGGARRGDGHAGRVREDAQPHTIRGPVGVSGGAADAGGRFSERRHRHGPRSVQLTGRARAANVDRARRRGRQRVRRRAREGRGREAQKGKGALPRPPQLLPGPREQSRLHGPRRLQPRRQQVQQKRPPEANPHARRRLGRRLRRRLLARPRVVPVRRQSRRALHRLRPPGGHAAPASSREDGGSPFAVLVVDDHHHQGRNTVVFGGEHAGGGVGDEPGRLDRAAQAVQVRGADQGPRRRRRRPPRNGGQRRRRLGR
mmetsp:Transcript_10034/g.30444  ORF Transcript_10034/g.30444 Transcript_10034/m.30444 type:complete len:562 (-) Transcript_10034:490-2175(-)